MCNIYLTVPGVKVSKAGGRLVIAKQDELLSSIPLDSVETISVFTKAQITYDIVTYIMNIGGHIIYVDKNGFISGTLNKDSKRTTTLLKQLHSIENDSIHLSIAKKIIQEKLSAQVKMLKGYNKTIKDSYLTTTINDLKFQINPISLCPDIATLRGLEGAAALKYFSCFNHLISNPDFVWNGRNKRPPRDPINAMLSYGYTLLEKDVRYLLAIKGLDTGIGYIHSTDGRKDSLVYDIMEPFRALAVDKLVLKLINLKKTALSDFDIQEDCCYFKWQALKDFIGYYEEYMGDYDEGIRKGIGNFINDISKRITLAN